MPSRQQGISLALIFISIYAALIIALHYSELTETRSATTMKSWFSSLWSIATVTTAQKVDLGWYPPSNTSINNLTTALRSEGVYGFIFNTSETPDAQYGTYNWCNMPHVRRTEYVKPASKYKLRYVEIVSLKLLPCYPMASN